jgi:excisionase family DNA binding protein
MPDLMTTREVAAYLRVKERKVYELVRERDIPCTRVSGKWLFPKRLIDVWLLEASEGPRPAAAAAPPPIIAGSQDPLLDWALQESGSDIAMLACGSAGGLDRLAGGRALGASLHLLDAETGEYNVAAIQRALSTRDVVAINWAWRDQGLVVAPGNPLGLTDVADLAGSDVRVVHRQDGSGSERLLRHLLAGAGLHVDDLTLAAETAKSETDLGLAVLDGRADAGLAVAAVARRLKLGFVALARERFDLVIGRRDYFEAPFQALVAFARDDRFRARAGELGGYDLIDSGRVVYVGP